MLKPRIRTHADPLSTLSKGRFEVAHLGTNTRRRVEAVSRESAKLAGAVLMNIPARRLVVVELGFALSGKGWA